MSGHISAFDPKVKPKRRLVVEDDGRRRYVHVRPVLYTSMPRCQLAPNPKRPTWRCKDKPTVLLSLPWTKDKGSVVGVFLCEPHVEYLISGRMVAKLVAHAA